MSQKKPRKALRNRNGTVWVSDEMKLRVIVYFNQTGESLNHIGDKFGVSNTCISSILTEYFKNKA
jgi:hypothetical protein